MASRSQQIKGLSLVISGDTTPLQTALKGVNGEIRNTKDQLKDVEKLLKLDPGNTELLTQKHKLLGEAVAETKEKLKTLKTANEEAAQSAAKYDAWKEKYDPIRSEIDSTSEKLKKLRTDAADADQQLSEGKISQEKYDAIQGEIRETEDRLKELKASAKDVDEEFGNPVSPEQYDALQREIIETTEELKKLEKQARESETSLQKIAAAGGKLKDVGGKIEGVGTALMPVTAALAGIGAAGAANFAEVDKTMQLTYKTMGATEEEAQKLSQAMKDAASNSTFGMSDAANATLNFARAGLDAEQAAAALAPAMNLAAGEGGNLDTVSAGLVATINGFHGSFEDAGKYADVFASACNNSALDVDSLSNSMSVAAPIFSAAGYTVNDAALYMGVMANNGIDADKAANSLKTGLARLVSPAKEGHEAMKQLGIEVTNADGSMKDSVTIQKELHDAFSKLSESEQIAAASAIFGKNQMAPWLALINTAPEDVQALDDNLSGASKSITSFSEKLKDHGTTMDELKGRMEKLGISADAVEYAFKTSNGSAQLFAEGLWEAADSGVSFDQVCEALGMSMEDMQTVMDETAGTTDEMADAMMSGFGGSIEKLKSSIDVLMSSIGEALAPTIQKIAEFIQNLVDKFNALSPAQQETIVKIGAVIAAVGPLLIIIGNVVSAVGSIMEFVPKLVSGVQNVIGIGGKLMGGLKSLWGVIIANPIVLIVAAIAAAVAAFIYFWNTSEEFREFWINLWETIKSVASAVVDAVVSFFTETIPEAFNSFVSFLKGLWEGVASFFSGLWEGIKETVSSAWEGIKETLSAIWEAISTIASDLWNGVKDFFGGIWEGIREAASTAWDGIKEMLSTVWEGLKDTASTIWNGVRDFFGKLWDGIGDKTSTAWDGIKDKLLTVWDHLSDKASTVWGGIKTTCTNITDAARREISDRWAALKDEFEVHGVSIEAIAEAVWDAVKDIYSFGFDFIDDLTGGRLSVLKDMFFDVWEDIKDIVSKGVDRLLSFLDFDWQLPHINLPHFSIQGQFSLNPPSVPYLWVDWYKKAMGDGIILNSPTIFGAAGGRLLGGGEAGPEAVVGVDSLRGMIEKAVDGAAANTRPMYMTTILEVDKMEFGRAVYKVNGDEMQRVGAKLVMT